MNLKIVGLGILVLLFCLNSILMIFGTQSWLQFYKKHNRFPRLQVNARKVKLIGTVSLVFVVFMVAAMVRDLSDGSFHWRGDPRSYGWKDLFSGQ